MRYTETDIARPSKKKKEIYDVFSDKMNDNLQEDILNSDPRVINIPFKSRKKE